MDLFSKPIEKYSLREYQSSALAAIISWHKYKDTPCIVDIATGGGKTHIISALVEHYYKLGQRVCLLAHRKELLEQSGGKITVPFGYYSASIGEKITDAQVIVAGIQSIYDKKLDRFDVIIVDEAHRVSNNEEEGRYWQFIEANAVDGKRPKVVGLTATPFRLKGGKLGWGDIVYEAKYPLLLSLGYLAPITNKAKDTPDLSSVKIVAGEYSEDELSCIMEDPGLIEAAIKNIIAFGQERTSILIFCVGVNHAKLLTKAMQENGMASAVLHGGTPKGEREKIIEDFKEGKLQHLLNCEVLLEGFDCPRTDMIVCLRPTKSKALWEQLIGRGVRLFEHKDNCFLLDMAGNLMEHGGLGTPFFEKSRKEKAPPKGRICPSCETYCEPRAKECPDCGYIFPKEEANKANHKDRADVNNSATFIPMETYQVKKVLYKEHVSKSGNTTLRIDYVCNSRYGSISEYLSPFSENEWARGKAWQFFKDRGHPLASPVESYSMEDLLWHCAFLKQPSEILVDQSEKFPRVKDYRYEPAQNRGGDTESIDPLAALGDDAIPF